jgi:regulator of protease activity HflC (stomatin/prohibitin superfamily)
MATIRRAFFLRHLRAESNQLILHFKRGRLAAQGVGLAYWFWPLGSALAQVPAEDLSTTFMLSERSADFQAVKVQCTLNYRVTDAALAASRVNFSISIDSGLYLEKPLDTLAAFWSQRVLGPAREYLAQAPLETVLRDGPQHIARQILSSVANDPELAAMGLKLVGVVIDQVVPNADVEKALQTPTREQIQSRADEAQFQRRALAVEKERAIKENELDTEINLSKRQELLLKQQGENEILQARQQASTQAERDRAEAARIEILANAEAARVRIEAQAQAAANLEIATAFADGERARHAVWEASPAATNAALVLQAFAEQVKNVNHLNITPDLLGNSLAELLRGSAAPTVSPAKD